jgi:hypothetical protein
MKDNEVRLWRVKNRCDRQKHSPVENNFGVSFCKDCGKLIQKF